MSSNGGFQGSAPGTLVQVEDAVMHYPVRTEGAVGRRRRLRAVDGVSFSISEGEALGLVGESGCGKTTVAKLIMRLITPVSGRIVFMGRDITGLGRREMRPVRRNMQIVFQDPFASLNPGMKAGDIVVFSDTSTETKVPKSPFVHRVRNWFGLVRVGRLLRRSGRRPSRLWFRLCVFRTNASCQR